MDEKFDFTFISEKEADIDLYKSRTHQRLADTILNLIDKSDESICIGIEGDYGVGKSTVIRLLRNDNSLTDHSICYYDAWIHEGDPLRKVFLESLIKDCGIEDVRLKKLRKKIISSKSTVTKTINKNLTWFGILLTVATFLVPLGLALSRKIDIYNILYYQSFFGNWYETFILILLLGPFLIISIKFVLLLLTNKSAFDPNNWSYLHKDHQEKIIETSYNEAKTTSVEFERNFWRIIKIIRSFDSDRKILIIFDNLDRTSNEDGIQLFNALQSMLKHKRSCKESESSLYRNIYIIVPYDNLTLGLGKFSAYIDKVMDLRLNLPQPTFSDWQEIAEKQIRSRFESWENLDDIVRIYSRSITDPSHSFTPRQLSIFINHVGVLRNHYPPYISNEILAYYVIYRFLKHKTHKELISELRNEKMPLKPDMAFLNSNNPQGEFAALLYDTEINTAYILLLEKDLNTALKSSASLLKELREKHVINFPQVFYNRLRTTDRKILLEYAESIVGAFGESNDIDLEPYKKELRKIFYNSYESLYVSFDSTFESNLVIAINFVANESIDLFWKTFAEQEIFFRLSNDEKSEDPFSKIWFLFRIFKQLKSKLVNKKLHIESSKIDILSLSYQAYLRGERIERMIEFESEEVRNEIQGKLSRVKQDSPLNEKVFYAIRLLNTCRVEPYYRMLDLYEELNGSIEFAKRNMSSFMVLISQALADPLQRGDAEKLVELHDSSLINNLNFVEVKEFAIVVFIVMPQYFVNNKNEMKKHWVVNFWYDPSLGISVDLVVLFILSHSLKDEFINLFKYQRFHILHEVLEYLLDEKLLDIRLLTDIQKQQVIRALNANSTVKKKFEQAVVGSNFDKDN